MIFIRKLFDWLPNMLRGWFRRFVIGNNNTAINIEIVLGEAAKSNPETANHVLDAALYAACQEIERRGGTGNLKKRIAKAMAKHGPKYATEFARYIQEEVKP